MATLGPDAPEREYYFARAMEPVLEEMLMQLAGGNRDAARACCFALDAAFHQTFTRGTLSTVLSYRLRRFIWFEHDEQGLLVRFVICYLDTGAPQFFAQEYLANTTLLVW